MRMGDSAYVSCGKVDLVLNSIRTQTLGLEAFTNVGIDPCKYRVLVVKSMHHFFAAFAPIATEVIYVNTPGALTLNFAEIQYQTLTRPCWPRVPDPFANRGAEK